jgi:hypothetical protein
VFGAWTAWHLRKAGQRVLLLDARGAAHARASSGGESRLTRGSYGSDEIYTRMRVRLAAAVEVAVGSVGLPVCTAPACCSSFQKREPYVDQSLEVHRGCKLPTQSSIAPPRAALSAVYLERHRGRLLEPNSACSWRAARCRRW